MQTLFISDLHLSPNRPDITACFLDFMQHQATQAQTLYVLGDLFEFWIGDDDNSDFALRIKQAFKDLTAKGIDCYFIQGNRDFLLGKKFCQQTGMTLLEDVAVIDLYGTSTVILHGDTLCTLDEAYQKFRAKVHRPWLQKLFLLIPLFIRQRIVKKVQNKARNDKAQKSLDIMDVTPEEVVKLFEHTQTRLMIHGHTHRPNTHHHQTQLGDAKRIVLGDWYEQGSILICDENGCELVNKSFTTEI